MVRNIVPFEEFENAVLEKIMEKNTSINKILRKQYKNSHVESRDFTGVGFFTDFKISKEVELIMEPVEYAYGDVDAIINDLDGFGFILYIKNGTMTCLEGYTWRDTWPKEIYKSLSEN